jgi:hypothetical protein
MELVLTRALITLLSSQITDLDFSHRKNPIMARHLLGMLEPSIVFQVNRDAGCPPGRTSDRGQKTRRLGPFPNRCPGVVAIQSSSAYLRSS